MIHVPMKTSGPLTMQTLLTINEKNVQCPKTSQTIHSLNNGKPTSAAPPVQPVPEQAPVSPVKYKPVPQLLKAVQKGQKVSLETYGKLSRIKACLGWNVTNASCDVDVSAFLLNSSGKVPGDTWFVFYGQETSPDGSTVFSVDSGTDRELISIDFTKLNPCVSKIVFVLTINEALERHLNFSMLKDAYIRIVNCTDNTELTSFKMSEYYSNVTSMMIGEIYQHNGAWKFNAIGNGVAKDLAGLCALYGVQVI